MSEKLQKLPFRASAYLQRLIGRELIRSDELAVVELVKNAYDSGATEVEITIQAPSIKHVGEILIRDNGAGMTLEQFRESFMFAGYSSRPDEVGRIGRMPTGEKGIGRFASDRLGAKLHVVTRAKGAIKELVADVSWGDFDDRKKEFSAVSAPYHLADPEYFHGNASGSLFIISSLREQWDTENLTALRTALAELLNPFGLPANFRITLVVPGSERYSGAIVHNGIVGANFEVLFRIDQDGRVSRLVKGPAGTSSERPQWHKTADVMPDLRDVTGRLLYFIKRPKKDNTFGITPGVKLYRDGFRIEPFGSKAADWLGVAERRAKRAGHAHIVPTRLFGFVSIFRDKNPKLVDTTSREALIESTAAIQLVSLLRKQLEFLEEVIRTQVNVPKWAVNKKVKVVELERARLQALNLMSFGLAHELRQPLHSVQFEAENIRTRLEQLGIQDADIVESQESIARGIERIDKNIRTIASLAKGSLGTSTLADLVVTVNDIAAYLQPRCSAEGIDLQSVLPEEQSAFIDHTALQIVLLNLVKNSIDAHQSANLSTGRQIVVSLDEYQGMHRLTVRDNAGGIPESIRPKIFKQFSTEKSGGMGVGLYLCHSILASKGGDISFSTVEGEGTSFTVKLPDDEED